MTKEDQEQLERDIRAWTGELFDRSDVALLLGLIDDLRRQLKHALSFDICDEAMVNMLEHKRQVAEGERVGSLKDNLLDACTDIRQLLKDKAALTQDAQRLIELNHNLSAEMESLSAHYAEVRGAFGNLCARIDRDGGHAQTDDIATDLARCDGIVANLFAERDALAAEVANLKAYALALAKEAEAALVKIAVMEGDLVIASGELMVDVPAPGTDMARVMTANAMMRRERNEARDKVKTWEAIAERDHGHPLPCDADALAARLARAEGALGHVSRHHEKCDCGCRYARAYFASTANESTKRKGTT